MNTRGDNLVPRIKISLTEQFYCRTCGTLSKFHPKMLIIVPVRKPGWIGEQLIAPICSECFEELKGNQNAKKETGETGNTGN